MYFSHGIFSSNRNHSSTSSSVLENERFSWGNVGTTWRVQGCFHVLTQLHFQFYFLGGISFKDFFGHKGMDDLKCIDVFFWKPRWLRDWPQLDGWNTVNMVKSVCTKKKWQHPPEVWRRLPLSFIFGDPIEIQTNGPQTANLHNLPLVDHSSFHPLLKKKIPPQKNAAVSFV